MPRGRTLRGTLTLALGRDTRHDGRRVDTKDGPADVGSTDEGKLEASEAAATRRRGERGCSPAEPGLPEVTAERPSSARRERSVSKELGEGLTSGRQLIRSADQAGDRASSRAVVI